MSSCKCGSDCSCGDDCKCGNSSGLENTTTETIISGVAPVMMFYEGAEYGAENDGCKCGNNCSCGSSCACGK